MALVTPWSRTFCPFCCHRFHLSEAPRRMRSGRRVPDPVVSDFFGPPIAPPDLEEIVPIPKRGMWGNLFRSVVVANDWHGDAAKVCPHCHMFLPTAASAGRLTPKVIAIIGTRSSGKSNYFGVLLDSLLRRMSAEVGLHMIDQETFSLNLGRQTTSDAEYRRRYYNRLFDRTNPTAVPPTQTAQSDATLRVPLIYRLESSAAGWWSRRRGRHALDLVLFDAAGEDLKDDDPRTLDQFYRFLQYAAGIIFLIDPTQVPGIRDRLSPETQDRCELVTDDAPDRLLSRVIQLFQRRTGLGPGGRIRVPVAFAFSKSDLLRPVLDKNSRVLRDCRHEDGFNQEDCRQVSDEVARCLTRWGEERLVRLVRDTFATSQFFALSALGQLPVQDGPGVLRLTRAISPLRVCDPLLWLLWKCGYIPTSPESGKGEQK